MKKFPFLILTMIAACCITSCGRTGGTLQSNIEPTATPNIRFYPAENNVLIQGIQRAAILPFADYSAQQEPIDYREWGGNIKIMEEIIDQLTTHGISVVIQEDINTLLVDNDIIKPIDEDYLIYGSLESEYNNNADISSPEYELKNFEHSPAMQEELEKIIEGNKAKRAAKNSKSPKLQGATVGLTKDKIIEIGQILEADIIFRGRIIDYGYKDIGTNSPMHRGILPIAFTAVKEFLLGRSKEYNQDSRKNAIRSAVVQIRIYAQDTSTGDMVWTNRAEIEYTPNSKSAYNDSHPKVMFDKAVKKGVDDLMGSFFSNTSTPAAAL